MKVFEAFGMNAARFRKDGAACAYCEQPDFFSSEKAFFDGFLKE